MVHLIPRSEGCPDGRNLVSKLFPRLGTLQHLRMLHVCKRPPLTEEIPSSRAWLCSCSGHIVKRSTGVHTVRDCNRSCMVHTIAGELLLPATVKASVGKVLYISLESFPWSLSLALCSSARAGGREGQTLHCKVLGSSSNPPSLALAGSLMDFVLIQLKMHVTACEKTSLLGIVSGVTTLLQEATPLNGCSDSS